MHFGLGEAFAPGAGATLMQTRPFSYRKPRRLRIIYAFPSDERTLLATGRIAVLRRYRRRRPLARWEQMRSTTVYEVRPAVSRS